ncbi:MAG: HlyD family efflux transporter periplasmic adaptor subunit [Oscillospiraceae bacterium]|nr:HlyD family efflux transporter periplasmic adaptor subunit [Oscillospiraceae bacterium]
MAKGKKSKKSRIVTIIVIILVVVLVLLAMLFRGSDTAYAEETVQLRDITRYHSFTGNVEAEEETTVLAEISQKVIELNFSEGDEVKEGDVIAVLDSTDIERAISIKEATMNSTDVATNYSIITSKNNYEDYLEGIENGTNSQLISAQAAFNSAKSALDTAEKNYLDAKEDLDNSTDANLVSAQKSVETAEKNLNDARQDYEDYLEDVNNEDYYSLLSLQTAVDDAYEEYNNKLNGTTNKAITEAKSKYEAALSNYNAIASSENADSANVAELKEKMETAKAAYESLAADTRTLSDFKEDYDDAVKAYENSKKNLDDSHDSTLTTLLRTYENAQTSYETAVRNLSDVEKSLSKTLETYYDNYMTAQTTYDDTLASYETVKITVDQTLESYKNAYQNALDSSDNTASALELASYYDQLEDCTIIAPASGIIDTLFIDLGSYTVQSQTVAVITDYDDLKVSVKIDEYDIENVNIGDTVSVYVNALDETVDGTVTDISRSAISTGGVSYFTADVSIDDMGKVKAGMSVEVKRVTVDLKDAVSISMDALQYEDDNTSYVLVSAGSGRGEPEKKYITVGSSDGTYIEVTEGLSEGDVILYTPNYASNIDLEQVRSQVMGG